ncbi:MAG: phage tail protein, partial [Candidatus Dormibacteraceae bacterium]
LGAQGGAMIPGATVSNLSQAFSSSNRFLGVTVVSSNSVPIPSASEIMPRQQLLSAPFAVQAQQASVASSLVPSLANVLSPPGSIIAYAGAAVPAGWLLCDGQTVSRTSYSNLWNAVGSVWGSGDDSTTFNLPDLRGLFLRGRDGQASRDPDKDTRSSPALGGQSGNQVGSIQNQSLEGHAHDAGGLRAGVYLVSGGLHTRQGAPGFTSTTSVSGQEAPAVAVVFLHRSRFLERAVTSLPLTRQVV